MKNYKGHKYYGELVDIDFVINEYYNADYCMFSTNNLKGSNAIDFLETIRSYVKSCKLDIEDGNSSTIFVEIQEECMKEFMVAIVKIRPDEFDEGDENCFRCWWD